jgi:hypothetical protein
MAMRQSDVRFDEFKQALDHVGNCATELVPRCCIKSGLWFWQEAATLPHVLPVVVVDGCILRPTPHTTRSGKSFTFTQGPQASLHAEFSHEITLGTD